MVFLLSENLLGWWQLSRLIPQEQWGRSYEKPWFNGLAVAIKGIQCLRTITTIK